MKRIRVLIADDHPLITLGLTTALAQMDFDVIGHVPDAADVKGRYLETAPDVLVLDIRFGDQAAAGLDVARELIKEDPGARIVFCTQFDAEEIVREAYRLGCRGFVTKSAAPDLLADAIRQAVVPGPPYLMPEIAQRLALIGLRGEESPLARLDPREIEVFKFLAKGLTNAEIAERLDLSAKTISTIGQSIKDKLEVQRPADITLLAVKHMLIQP